MASRSRLKDDDRLLAWVALLAGGLMLAQVSTRQSAFGWYVFLPMQMLAFGACTVLASWANRRVFGLCAALMLLCAVAHDARRVDHRLRHKVDNNAQLTTAAQDMAALTSALALTHPCAKQGHVDILVPSASPSAMPMRTSLKRRVFHQWTAPDYIVLNARSMLAPEHSGLATLVELQDFSRYTLKQRVGSLGLYVRRDLTCEAHQRP